MKNKKKQSSLTGILNAVDKQPMVPRICDECYDILTESIAAAGYNNMVAVHCPHYMVLMEVELVDGAPLGVVMTGPITKDEADEKINSAFGFESSVDPAHQA